MDGYFVAPDAENVPCIWRERGDYPVPVLGRPVLRDDPELWDAIVALVNGGVNDVRRYATLMLDSISVDRAEMARDLLDLLDGEVRA